MSDKRKRWFLEGDTPDDITALIVVEMWKFINRDIKNKDIIALAKSLKGNNPNATIKNIYDYVLKNHPYKSDPAGREKLTAPARLINSFFKGEDCDGHTMLVIALAGAVGIKGRIITIAWRNDQFTHVYPELWNGSTWVRADVSWKEYGHEPKVSVKRKKVWSNPMKLEIETLGDKKPCGCGGRCGGKSKNPKNMNVNVNPILIGNDLKQFLEAHNNTNMPFDVNAGGGHSQTRTIEKQVQVPVDRIVEKKVYPEGEVETASAIAKRETELRQVPVSIINDKRKGTAYVYPYFV
jgi:hypothetical protein